MIKLLFELVDPEVTYEVDSLPSLKMVFHYLHCFAWRFASGLRDHHRTKDTLRLSSNRIGLRECRECSLGGSRYTFEELCVERAYTP